MRGYYAWLGKDGAGWISSTAAVNEAALAQRIQDFSAAGADEIVIAPCSAEFAQLDRIADVALCLPAFA